MDGLLLLDKPTGPTSHDLVASVKHLLGGVKTGHAGTLDPLASGLLVILVGRATKFAPYIPGDPKVYEGCILLGLTTDSLDIAGKPLAEGVYDRGQEPAREALASLTGVIEQLPPMYSAVKYKGQPLYRYARRGEDVPRKSRRVRVYHSEMCGFRAMDGLAEIDFRIACSTGTYVRELAERVGDILGCGGVISELRRIASGPFRVEDAATMQDVGERVAKGEDFLVPLGRALESYKTVELTSGGLEVARNGVPLSGEMLSRADANIVKGDVVAIFACEEFLGMHRVVQVSPFASRALCMM